MNIDIVLDEANEYLLSGRVSQGIRLLLQLGINKWGTKIFEELEELLIEAIELEDQAFNSAIEFRKAEISKSVQLYMDNLSFSYNDDLLLEKHKEILKEEQIRKNFKSIYSIRLSNAILYLVLFSVPVLLLIFRSEIKNVLDSVFNSHINEVQTSEKEAEIFESPGIYTIKPVRKCQLVTSELIRVVYITKTDFIKEEGVFYRLEDITQNNLYFAEDLPENTLLTYKNLGVCQ